MVVADSAAMAGMAVVAALVPLAEPVAAAVVAAVVAEDEACGDDDDGDDACSGSVLGSHISNYPALMGESA